MYVEEQVIDWLKAIMNFPPTSSGTLVTGTSMANLSGLLIARDNVTDQQVRDKGLQSKMPKLVMYASEETHGCVTKAADIIGIGRSAVRMVPVDTSFKMNTRKLAAAIAVDKKAGRKPFCVVANVGTVVNVGGDIWHFWQPTSVGNGKV